MGNNTADDLPSAQDVPSLAFEQAYAALEATVAALESGELTLERSMELYETGVALSERCGELLAAAELRVKKVDAEGRDAGELES